jgi:hypothetical protein
MPKFTPKHLHSDTLSKMTKSLKKHFDQLGDKIEDKINDIDVKEAKEAIMDFTAPIVVSIANIGKAVIENIITHRINKDKNMTDAQKASAIAALDLALEQSASLFFTNYEELFEKVTGKTFDLADDPDLAAQEDAIADQIAHGRFDAGDIKDFAQDLGKVAIENTDASDALTDAVKTAIDGKPADLIVEGASIVTDGASDKILTTEDVAGVLHGNTDDMLDIAEKVASEITDGKSDILFDVLTGDQASGATTTAEEVADTPLVGETA